MWFSKDLKIFKDKPGSGAEGGGRGVRGGAGGGGKE